MLAKLAARFYLPLHFALFALVVAPSAGQEPSEIEPAATEEIETDRDSFTPSTSTVRPGRTMIESAYSFIDNRGVPDTHSFPELIVRYGLSELFELRMGWNYEIGGASNSVTGNAPGGHGERRSEIEEEANLLYGAKLFLSSQSTWIPESSVIVQSLTPTAGESTRTHFTVTPVLGWRLPNDCVWDIAFRYGTGNAEQDTYNTWSPSTVIKVPVNERWKVHAEYFGGFTTDKEIKSSQHFLSPGVSYLINNDYEVGVRAGWGLNNQSPEFIANAGFGILF